ncbi:ATP-binding protein [Metallosphaera javensis (ex Sakai et al. 2022)]|uniref:ATP-binding protein n=1 Tax=Metallosphaera javensis (ex Sakai et al. 2022) TaxID=2775498 RepID=UPI00258ED949|nr:MAG: cell division protein [Metallosphaera javensis (ex Sakai et al. 2022)]
MSLDFLYLDQIKTLESQAESYLRSGDQENARKTFEKIAMLYEKASSVAKSPSTRDLYMRKAREYREKSLSPRKVLKEGSQGDETDYRVIAESMIERTDLSWDDVVGLEDVKEVLRRAVFMARAKPDKPVKLDPPRSVLLFGPPGTGKTLLASVASNSVSATFFNADVSKILSKYVGDSPKTVDALFSLARERAPSLIFFDEIDSITVSREEGQNVGTGLLQKLLVEMDGFRKSSSLVIIMAGTNRPWALDEAVVNRFDYRIYVPPPDLEARKGIFRLELEKKGFEIEGDYDDLARRTEGYTGREISHICRKAVMFMIKRLNPDMRDEVKEIRIGKIKRDELYRAIQDTRPSVSGEILKKYQEWYERYGSS